MPRNNIAAGDVPVSPAMDNKLGISKQHRLQFGVSMC